MNHPVFLVAFGVAIWLSIMWAVLFLYDNLRDEEGRRRSESPAILSAVFLAWSAYGALVVFWLRQ